MRQRLEEKNRLIEKKTQAALQAQQERNRLNTELTELKDHMDIKDRKINVLQRKVGWLVAIGVRSATISSSLTDIIRHDFSKTFLSHIIKCKKVKYNMQFGRLRI